MVKLSSADTFRSVETSVVYDINGDEIRSLSGEKDVYYVSYEDIPQNFINAMIAVEDKKFYKHHGLDTEGIARAFVALIKHDGKITQGGSTITQQLAKNVFLSNEVTWKRKVIEAFVALDLEDKYSKEQILEFYLNNIYFANGYYGIDAAAKGYFGQELTELSLSQIAFLCAIPNSPTYYDPVEHKDHTLKRRDKILLNMQQEGYINELDYTLASSEEITLNMHKEKRNNYAETYIYYQATQALMQVGGFTLQYDFATDQDRKEYKTAYDAAYTESQQSLYTGGYRIYTSMDLDLQKQLQKQVDTVLADYTEKSDDGVYALQGAAVCIDNQSGYVCAVVGGRSQKDIVGYTLNRAFQSPRQPGSSIKPLNVYTPVFMEGYTPESKVTAYDDQGKSLRTMRVDEAVARSNNDIARQVYKEITPGKGMSYLTKMNFKSLMPEDKEVMAGALGGFTYGATVEEMAAAYACLANGGQYMAPDCIQKITDADGETIYENPRQTTRVYDANAAAMMTSALEKVLKPGGTAAGYALDGMHCAGKTGTTNKNYDGWFCGYTPYYTTAVWVGYDMPKQLKSLQGNTYPVRIWNQFMEEIHKNKRDLEFSTFFYQKPKKEENLITTESAQESTTAKPKQNRTTQEKTTQAASTRTEADTQAQTTTEQTTTEQPEAPSTQEQPQTTQAQSTTTSDQEEQVQPDTTTPTTQTP